jgi:penicillin-binding protein 1A
MSKLENILEKVPKSIKILWALLLFGLILIAFLFIYISNFELPDTRELENPKYEIASQILSEDGKELGKAFTLNREWLTYKDINPKIVKTLIATEDIRYFEHSGIDFRGTLRAVVFLSTKGGASTITQQLSKLFFTQKSKSKLTRIWQKLKEWVIAVEFERRYTKEEILAMYLNKFDFLYGAIGIGTASKTYFNKNQKNLDYHEAAVLIGMLKNPYLYNPKVNMDRAISRKKVVLGQLLKAKEIDESKYEKFNKNKIDITGFSKEEYFTGIAPYFRAEVVKTVKNILEDPKYRKGDGSKYNIYTDGLKIHTTVNYKMQEYAEVSMREHMVNLQKKYNTVWKGKDPWVFGAVDAAQKTLRTNNLYEQFRTSPRFRDMRQTYMNASISEISDDIPEARLSDIDIFRLFDSEKDKSHLEKLEDQGKITPSQLDIYNEIKGHPSWPKVKTQWNKLKKDAEAIFNKPVSMKIYDYTTGKEKQVVMSPKDSIRHHQMHLQIGSLGVDPKTGNVKFWIGGINHKYFQYDHVRSNRQVGSTFKPFIYATAIIEQAISPCFKVPDIKQCIPANDPNFGLMEAWCPNNADGKNSGQLITLKEGLKESKNSVSVYLMKELGNVEAVKNFVSNLGIAKDRIPNAPSICLGTPELSAYDMASAYTAFANNGTHSEPIYISHITDKDGKLIYSAIPEQKKAVNPSYNDVIVNMLQYVAQPIKNKFKSTIAGKTGTTNSYKDGWYVGFTPEIVVSTWVGGDVEWIRFNRLEDGQGAVMARPFFEKFLTKVENDKTLNYNILSKFSTSPDKIVELDCTKYSAPQSSEEETPAKVDEFESENEGNN